MARAIPQYNRQVLPGGIQNAPNASTAVRAQADPAAAGLNQLVQTAAGVAQTVLDVDRKKTEDRAAVDVANTLSKGQVFWQEDFTRRSQAWKPGDPDMRDTIGKDFDKWVSESEQALPTEASRNYFRQNALQMKTKMQLGAFEFQERATTERLNVDTAVGIQADENVVYNDPTQLAEINDRRVRTIFARTDISEAEKTKQASDFRRSLYQAAERGQVERDPLGWYRARYGEPGAQQAGSGAAQSALPTGWTNTGGTPDAVQGMTAAGNIDLTQRPSVKNKDGSISTVRSMSVTFDDGTYLIPTVVGDKVVSDDEAVAEFRKTGQHLGKFENDKAADAYGENLHKQQERMYATPTPGTGPADTGAVQPQPKSRDVAMSIFSQESSHGKADTSKFNSQQVTGPMQIQKATFDGMKRLGIIPQSYDISNPEQNKDAGFKWVDYLYNKYNGDAAKVAAAYYGGEKAVRPDGTIRRDMGNRSRPQDPTVGQYVDQVLKRMGRSQSAGSTEGTGPAPISGAPSTFTGMDWQQQSALRRMAETKIAQGEAVYKAQTNDTLKNLTAMHKDGVVEAQEMSPDVFNRAYGVQGPAMYQQYQKSREMGGQIAGFKTQSNAEIQAAVEASRPDADTQDYAAADERFRTTVAAASQILKVRQADPSGYAAQNNTDLAAQLAVLSDPATPAEERPALRQAYVRDNLAEQQRLGLNPTILTPGQVDQIANQAMNATRPEDSANLINGLQAEYGDYFPQMFGELVAKGKINGELLIIPNLDSATSRETVSRLARIKESELTVGIEASDQKTVKELAIDSASLLAKTFPLPTAQGAETLDAYAGMTRKIAYQLMNSGLSPAKAAERANEMLLGKYDIQDTIRFPLSVDQSAVYRGIESKMNQDMDSFDLPEDVSRGRDDEALLSEWQNTVRARGKWYTNDNDDGVNLWATGANGVPYQVTINGEPVSYTWDQLAVENEAAMTQPENPTRAAFGVFRRQQTPATQE